MRRATIRTRCDDADATVLARALRPDNTDEMQTTVTDDGTLETQIERETTGGLQATVDDYVVNLEVATEVTAVAAGIDVALSGTDADAPTTDASDATRDAQTERPADAGDASTDEHNI